MFLDRHILPELGRMPLTRIGERDYLRFVGTLADKGLSPASVRSITNTLTAVLNGAVSAGLLAPSPRPARLRLRLRNAAEAVILTHTEIRELIEEVPGRYQALVFLLAYAGLRWSEAAGLTRQRGHPAAAERGRELHRRELRAGEEPSQPTDDRAVFGHRFGVGGAPADLPRGRHRAW